MRIRLLQNVLQPKNLLCEYVKPCTNRIVTYSLLKQEKNLSTNSQKYIKNDDSQKLSHNLSSSINVSHQILEDENAEIIYDSEKLETINLEDLKVDDQDHDPYKDMNLERGTKGVFEIEELVSLLQNDKAKHIFVAAVPPELSYVDYLVVATGKSTKHMEALAAFILKVYKLKRHKTDLIPKIEGKNSKQWIAMDLGNIALHIFSSSARSLYDLETLWSVGPDYDDKNNNNMPDDIMDQYNEFLSNLEPLENEEQNEDIKDQSS